MFDFLIRKNFVKSAQRFINKLNPKVLVHIPYDLPLPSVNIVKRMCVVVSKINGLEADFEKLSDQELRQKTEEFRKRFTQAIEDAKRQFVEAQEQFKKSASHEDREQASLDLDKAREDLKREKKKILDGILPEAFAVVREAGKRSLSMRHFDVQLIGGIVLHQGNIAEMITGEGKTLVATLAAYLNAVTSEGVHIVTVNDYLAKRDREWMGPLYEFLGLTVGVIQHDMDHVSRQEAYACDITYGTNNEFGFDYLRDNMVNYKEEMVQRGHHFAIVDEVDSILIDEARTPLIISGPAEESTDKYYTANTIAKQLKGRRITEQEQIEAKHKEEDLSVGYDYLADEKARSIALTETGEEKAAKLFGVDNLHEIETMGYRHHVLQALRAKEFFKLDVDYVTRDGGVIIVDEFTGRMMPGRRWSDGLHQAVEAKEGIKIERENQTLATITFQNYFRMYEKLAGMTGTAYTEANEFKEIYKLDCMVIPTNQVLQRKNNSDCIYKTTKEKFAAVVSEIENLYKKGQPVLVGTISIEKSELLSAFLKRKGIAHQVLNAKYHDLEAQIIAQAGRYKAVTIATNMAGRGTDIVLGGNVEFLARTLADQKAKEMENEQSTQELTKKFITQFREQVKEEHKKVVEAGGLYVLGTERHESRRIDNQLRGRCGRQGDPGESRFFVSLEDDLMRLFASDRIVAVMDKLGMEEGQVIEHPWVTKALEVAQKRVENHNFEIRKQLLEFDNVMNRQREAIYSLRKNILESDSIKDRIEEAIAETVAILLEQHMATNKNDEGWDTDGFAIYLKTKFHVDLNVNKDELRDMPVDEIRPKVLEGLLTVYQKKENEITAEHLRQLEKMVFLHTIDAKWKDHLYAMDQLKEGIGLRSYAHRDPIIEYKREGFVMFQMMYDSIHQEVVEMIFKLQPASGQQKMKSVFSSLPQRFIHQDFSSLSQQAAQQKALANSPDDTQPVKSSQQPIHSDAPKVGRNEPCPCGSGKKYKKCCGR